LAGRQGFGLFTVKSSSEDRIEAVSLKGVDFGLASTCEIRDVVVDRLTIAFELAGICGVPDFDAVSLAFDLALAGTRGDRGLDASPLEVDFGLDGACGVLGLELAGVLGALCPIPSPAFTTAPASLRFNTGNFFVFFPNPKYSFSISAPDGRRSSRSGLLAKSPRRASASPGVRGVLLAMSSRPGVGA